MGLFGGSKKKTETKNTSITNSNPIQGGNAPVIGVTPGQVGGSLSTSIDLTYTDLGAVAAGVDLSKTALSGGYNDLALARAGLLEYQNAIAAQSQNTLNTLGDSIVQTRAAINDNLTTALEFAESAGQPDKAIAQDAIQYGFIAVGLFALAMVAGGN